MGSSSYSDDHYKARSAYRAQNNVPTFQHSADIKSGKVAAGVADILNIRGKVRESRDSAAHPESLAIMVFFDETGSMGEVPQIAQKKLPNLMGLLLRKGYVDHPQIMFGAIGDWTNHEKAPLQVGQFESGLEMDDCLTAIYLEGNGGGTFHESYQNVLYCAARKTSIDCFEKRGHKGYLFMIGDELPYDVARREEIQQLFGDTVEGDIPVEQLVAEVKEKYHVFFVIPLAETQQGRDPRLRNRWAQLLGNDHVIALEATEGICECIAMAIGIQEGRIDINAAQAHMKEVGASDAVVRGVVAGVSELARSTALAPIGTGDLPGSLTRSQGVTRL